MTSTTTTAAERQAQRDRDDLEQLTNEQRMRVCALRQAERILSAAAGSTGLVQRPRVGGDELQALAAYILTGRYGFERTVVLDGDDKGSPGD